MNIDAGQIEICPHDLLQPEGRRPDLGVVIVVPLGSPLSDLFIENAHSDDAGLFVDMLTNPVLDQLSQ